MTNGDTREIEDEIFDMHYRDKLAINEIADRKGIHRNTVSRVLDRAYQNRGLKRPDGRSQRRDRRSA